MEWQVSGSSTRSPPLLTPLTSAEPIQPRITGPGLLSNFRDVKFTMFDMGFTQGSPQSVVLERTDIAQRNEDEIGHREK